MSNMILPVVCLALLGLASPALRAQEAAGGTEPKPAQLDFLSDAEWQELSAARAKALADNPDLKKQDAALRVEARKMRESDAEPTPEQRRQLQEKFRTDQQSVRAAMLKVDGKLQPVFDKIDKQMSILRAKRSQEGGPAGAPPAKT